MKKLLTLALLLLQLAVKAQQKEEEPPADFIAQMERLASPVPEDTAQENLILNMGSAKYDFPTYSLSKKFIHAEHPISNESAKLKELRLAKLSTAYKLMGLITKLRDTAIYLIRKDFNFNDGSPLQHKIAYSWGSKDHTIRQNPPGIGDMCTYKIHGLDCSGYIYQLFKLNNILLPVARCNADTERQPLFLKQYLTRYFNPHTFDVVDLGAISLNQIQSGDLIYFKNSNGAVYHIGILFVNAAGVVSCYQSLGQPNRSETNDQYCKSNLDDSHGPIVKNVTEGFLKGLANKYGCVRIIGVDRK